MIRDSPFLISMKTTIEAYTITVRRKREKDPLLFSDSPDIYDLMAHDNVSFIKYIDN